jgi:hypothetical protein
MDNVKKHKKCTPIRELKKNIMQKEDATFEIRVHFMNFEKNKF